MWSSFNNKPLCQMESKFSFFKSVFLPGFCMRLWRLYYLYGLLFFFSGNLLWHAQALFFFQNEFLCNFLLLFCHKAKISFLSIICLRCLSIQWMLFSYSRITIILSHIVFTQVPMNKIRPVYTATNLPPTCKITCLLD